MNLSQQISPSMTMVPDADQTFGQYVRELLASSKGFGGPFAGWQGSPEQPQQPKIVDGLFGKYLPQNESSGGGAVDFGGGGRQPTLTEREAMAFGLTRNAPDFRTGLLGGIVGLGMNALGNWEKDNIIDNISNSLGLFGTEQPGGVQTVQGPYGGYTRSSPESIANYDLATFGYGHPGYSNETETMNDSYTSSEPSGGGGDYSPSAAETSQMSDQGYSYY